MPQAKFVFYADKHNAVPVLSWLDVQPEKVQEKILTAIRLLSSLGHESRRPLWAFLRDEIYELRVQHQNVHYRLLCFFHGRGTIVAAHGCTKKGAVAPADIERAINRKIEFRSSPGIHTYIENK